MTFSFGILQRICFVVHEAKQTSERETALLLIHAPSLWATSSHLFSMLLLRSEYTSLRLLPDYKGALERKAPHSRPLNIVKLPTQIFGRACGRDSVQSPLLMCFSKVCGNRCVRITSGLTALLHSSQGLAGSGTQRPSTVSTACYF